LKKSLFRLCVFGVLVLMLCAIAGCGSSTDNKGSEDASSEQANEVKVGFLFPLSGGSAAIGQQQVTGIKIAVDEINEAGGIKALNGAKLNPVIADSESKPDVGVSQAQRLIEQEKVVAIVGAYNSGVSFPASEVCQRYKTPWIGQGAVKNEITERGFEWVFRINNKASYDAIEQYEALKTLEEEKGYDVKKIGIIYEGTDWGRSAAEYQKEYAPDYGYEIVLDEPINAGASDLSPLMSKIKKANPEALFVSLYTPESILFIKAFYDNKIDLPGGLWSVGGGMEDPTFYEAVPQEAVEYMFVQEDYDIGGPRRLDSLAKLAEEAIERDGWFNGYVAQGYAATYVVKEVLEKAGSADKEAIRKALTEIEITEGPALATGYQKIKFDENGQNTFAHGTISQNLQGTRPDLDPGVAGRGAFVIWPKENRELAVEDIVFPVPSWSER